MTRRFAAWLVAAVLAWTYGVPVHRAYRCVGDAPKVKTQHGCCPDDDQAATSIGRPCCERLPVVAVSAATLSHGAASASVPPPAAVFVALAQFVAPVGTPAASRIRGGTSPPTQHPRIDTVLRI